VAVTPDGSRLYVNYQCGGPSGSSGHDAVGIFDVATNSFLTSITGLPNVGSSITISPNGSQVWENGGDACSSIAYDHVGCPAVPGVPEAVINALGTTTNSLLQTLGFAPSAGFVSFSPDGSSAYVGGNSLTIIDTTSFAVIGTVPLPASGSVVFTPDRARAYAVVSALNSVAVLNVTGGF
jgi:hypothetical protein